MFKKTRNVVLMGAALAAISFGGSALANAGAAPASPAQGTSAAKRQGTETQAAKAGADAAITNAGRPDSANDQETADDGRSVAGGNDAETADGPETGSEISESDGPGGHADEPGNPNAEHQAGGQE